VGQTPTDTEVQGTDYREGNGGMQLSGAAAGLGLEAHGEREPVNAGLMTHESCNVIFDSEPFFVP
jgi:hypothetical protein